MNQYLEKLQQNRKAILALTSNLTVEQFNFIPEGYHNNIIWNLGHMITVSENTLSKNSDFVLPVHKFDITLFGKNKKPETPLSSQEISFIREALFETVRLFQQSAHIDDSRTMEIGTGSQKITVGVLHFLLFHDSMHINTIEKLLRMV